MGTWARTAAPAEKLADFTSNLNHLTRRNDNLDHARSRGDIHHVKCNGELSLEQSEGDSLWNDIRQDAEEMCEEERGSLLGVEASELLLGIVKSSVLDQGSLEEALSAHLASKLSSDSAPSHRWYAILLKAFTQGTSPSGNNIRDLMRQDLTAIKERDPACPSSGHAFLYFKGFHGIQVYRAAHWLWWKGLKSLASALQSRSSEVFGMDIHPAAQLGSGIMIDHATGVVIGETAVVGNGCTLLHGVTLGGNGKQQGDRHPKLGYNVLVGASASILGNVKVGDGAKIGASAVVLNDIPDFATAVGCPAKIIGRAKEDNPAVVLDHSCKQVTLYTQSMKCLCPYRHLYPSKPGCLGPGDFLQRLQQAFEVDVPREEAMALFFELDTDHDGELLETEFDKYLSVLKETLAKD
ncbi:hypothetical protein GOP47_0004386 [Adiantum capillus-veneris]|uniref:serine O-acetyltransferase n=1 Tax=Adiantum capillus-veneris TaxID=13818 RepID=A0A9D4ZMJ6_ADICA|nr:hypothetical protein GOP47_0004386 [Adiantum capillus-veneris]